MHKIANVLNALPKKLHTAAKGHLKEIWTADTRSDARGAFTHFKAVYEAKHPMAVATVERNLERLLSFYDFSAEHWSHLRSSNVIESAFATVRHRTRKTKGNGSRAATLAMIHKLGREAERSWRRLNKPELLRHLLDGVTFIDGTAQHPARELTPDDSGKRAAIFTSTSGRPYARFGGADKDRFGHLLGVKSPWRVSLVEQEKMALTLTIHLRLDADARLCCPTCAKACPRYDSRRRSWRHLDTMQFRTFVEADVPRIRCEEHGVIQISVPWAEDSSPYTALFEREVIIRLGDASLSAVARNVKLSWNAVDGIMLRAVRRGLARRTSLPPEHRSIDETSFQRRHGYITVVTEQTTGAVLYVADDRRRE